MLDGFLPHIAMLDMLTANGGKHMAWTPDEDYWARKLNREREAIEELKAKIPTLTEPRQIEAHELYLESVKRTLKIDEDRYRTWRNKRQNIERGI